MNAIEKSMIMIKDQDNVYFNFMIVLMILIMLSSYSYSQKNEFRKIENKAFKLGEKLTFEVNYGFVTAGIAEYSIPKIVKLAGRDVYNVVFNVSSVSAFDPFYKVREFPLFILEEHLTTLK